MGKKNDYNKKWDGANNAHDCRGHDQISGFLQALLGVGSVFLAGRAAGGQSRLRLSPPADLALRKEALKEKRRTWASVDVEEGDGPKNCPARRLSATSFCSKQTKVEKHLELTSCSPWNELKIGSLRAINGFGISINFHSKNYFCWIKAVFYAAIWSRRLCMTFSVIEVENWE